MSTDDAARKYTVSPAWVRRLLHRRRQTGETTPRKQRHGPVPLTVTHGEQIRQAIRNQPDATLTELRMRLGLTVALSNLWGAVTALGLRLKKSNAGGGAGSAGREAAACPLAGVAAADGP
jgi:transposase